MGLFGKLANDKWTTGFASRPWLIVPMCSGIHLTYAIGCWIDQSVAKITALHFANIFFGRILPFALVFAGITAIIPMLIKMKARDTHLYLWPQQFMLMLMAASAVAAAYSGKYPDGYVAYWLFILIDQSFAIWLTLGHLAAMIRNAKFK